MKQTCARTAALLLTVLALAGCTEPAAETGGSLPAAREESRDRVTALVDSLPAPQTDAFEFARAASDEGAEGVDLIGIESYEAEREDGPFGSLSFRTPVDPEEFPDSEPDAFCFRVPFSAAGPVVGDGEGSVEDIDCPDDVTVITPAPAEG